MNRSRHQGWPCANVYSWALRFGAIASLGLFSQAVLSQGTASAQDSQRATEQSRAAPANTQRNDALEEVVVTGIRASLRDALEVKKTADVVVDAISAEDIGDFPDKNLGEALQRITGVQINRQDGEGRGVSIRGAAPYLNRVEINGTAALSESVGGGRDVDFRDLPVEFVSRIEVVKSATPDMTEGGLGGTVRVVTRRPFDNGGVPYLAGSAQAVYSNLAEEYDPKFALIGSRTFFEDRLGVLFAGTYEERHLFNNESRTTGWREVPQGSKTFLPDIPREVINRRETNRPALMSIVEWRPSDEMRLYAEGTYARGKEDVASQFMQLSAGLGAVDTSRTVFGADNTVVHYEVVDVPTAPPAQRLALAYRNILGNLTRVGKTTALGGDWELDKLRFDGKLTYAVADVENLEKNATATIVGLPRAVVDYNNPQHAPNFSFPGLDPTTSQGITQLDAVFNPRRNIQDEVTAKFNVEYQPELPWLTSLKTGVEARRLNMDQVSFGETVTLNGLDSNGVANPAVLAQIRSIVDQHSLVNDIPFFKTGDLGYDGGVRHWVDNRDAVFNAIGNPTPYDAPRLLDTWNVEEETLGAYVQASFGLSDLRIPVNGVVGVRWVDTDTLSSGFNQFTRINPVTGVRETLIAPGSQSGGYTKWLPSLNLRLGLIPDRLQGRLTAGKVMARAQPQDLALRQSLDSSLVNGAGSRGNPNLQPFEATQYDAGVEWYFSDQDFASLTFFRKEISSFIQTVTVTENIDGRDFAINTPVNGTQEVTINGIEAGVQYSFDFLPEPFNGFGALANFTYQDDKGYEEVDVITQKPLPFVGLSRTSYNASLYFENQRFSIRASYNWRDEYLITPRGRGNNPEFGEAFGQLDASFNFNVTDNTTLFVEGINLTDEVRIENANSEMRRTIIETFGKRYFAGVRVKL